MASLTRGAALCADLHVDANDLAVFIFAWHCQARLGSCAGGSGFTDSRHSTLGEFAWDEFRRGAEELRISTLAQFKARALQWGAALLTRRRSASSP